MYSSFSPFSSDFGLGYVLALYPLLHKLEADGIIKAEVQEINGRSRKYYLLTDKGKKQQATQEDEMRSYLFNLKTIFDI